MKFFAVAATMAVAVSAVTVADLPSCATTCALNAVGSSKCAVTDTACLCKDTAYAAALTACVQTGCDTADQGKTLTVSKELCAPYVSTSSSVTALAAAGTTTSSHTAATPAIAAATGNAAATNGTGYAGTTAKPVPYTGGADALKAGQWMGFFALVGLVAL